MQSHYVIHRAVLFGKSQCALGASESPLLDAQLLLQAVLDCDRQYLYMHPDQALSDEQWERYRQLIEQRKAGQPIAYLVGTRDFWNMSLQVNASTLIPRPDTEILVEQALKLALPVQARVLELGTGTGAISLALAHERPTWQFCAVDLSEEAVALARRNRDTYGLTERVDILQSNWFDALAGRSANSRRFDLIVSNPPYIDPDDIHLEQGDVRFEPRSALVAEDHGFADLRHIIEHGKGYLAPGGWIILEHGYQQAAKVGQIFSETGYEKVNTAADYANLDRVTFAQRKHD
ncbi:MAG: peptide chain release factor N(5)-glutamine methyltransferase [Idiomarina sp.]|nr:peptide chain release factor N(5)-glutamine methyltransferase [Idiomarina sp.]